MKSIKYGNLNLMYKNKVFKINIESDNNGKISITEETYNEFSDSIKVCIGSIIGEYRIDELREKEHDITNEVIREMKENLFKNASNKITHYSSKVLDGLLMSVVINEFNFYKVENYYV